MSYGFVFALRLIAAHGEAERRLIRNRLGGGAAAEGNDLTGMHPQSFVCPCAERPISAGCRLILSMFQANAHAAWFGVLYYLCCAGRIERRTELPPAAE